MNSQTLQLALASLLVKKKLLTEGEIIAEMEQMDEEMYRANPTLKAVECLMQVDVKGFLSTMANKKEGKKDASRD
jgi:hypothetical protein